MSTETQTKNMALPKLAALNIEKDGPLDMLIIGGGPAGLSAAIYSARAGLKTAIIEKALLGGMALTTTLIENYPGFPNGISGQHLAILLEAQAQKLGVKNSWMEVSKIEDSTPYKKVFAEGKELEAHAIIIASGSEPKKLDVPGEENLRGMGVSYCAICDGPFYKGKTVAVIGGGNAAIEEAIHLTRFAEKVLVIHRRDKLRADKVLADRAARNPKIYFHWDSAAQEIKGEKKVEGLLIKNVKSEKTTTLAVDGVFIYIGVMPNTSFIKDLVKLTPEGFIIADNDMQTNIPGIFACGDVRDKKLRQIITAAADGAIAAFSAYKFIDGQLKSN